MKKKWFRRWFGLETYQKWRKFGSDCFDNWSMMDWMVSKSQFFVHLHEGISLAEELFPILKFLGPSLSPALWGREGKRGSPKFYFRGNLVESLAVTAPTRWSVTDMIVKRK